MAREQLMALTLKDLQEATCERDSPECDNKTLFFHGRCHPAAPQQVSFTKGQTFLRIECDICRELIAEVAIKPELPKPESKKYSPLYEVTISKQEYEELKEKAQMYDELNK